MLPEAENIANTGFGLRSAKNTGIYGVFCSGNLKKRETTDYLVIFRGAQKRENKMRYKKKKTKKKKKKK